MERDFNNLSPQIQEKVIDIQKVLNEFADENSPEQENMIFTPQNEAGHRTVIFKLIRSEDGKLSYEFESISLLVW